jgi:hypothetical protein
VDFRFNERNIVLFAHIVAAILSIGPVTVAASIFPRSLLQGEWQVARAMHRITSRYGPVHLLILFFGLWLAWRFHWFKFAWVSWAIGLFVLAAVTMVVLVEPEQKRLLAREGGEPVSKRELTKVRTLTGIYGLLWVTILYLMIAKPS